MTTPPTAPRILAVRFGAIGDIMLVTPLLRALRARHPDAYIAVTTKERFQPLLSANPRVDRVIPLTPSTSLGTLAADLRRERFTHFLDLHDNLRSWGLRVLVPGRWRGHPKYRWARSVLIRTKRNVYPAGTPPIPERFFDAARDLDVRPDGEPAELFIDDAEQAAALAWLEEHELGRDRPLVVVAPLAAHQTKRWPMASWQHLVERLTGKDVDVAVVGGPDPEDVAVCRAVGERADGTEGRGRVASAAGAMGLQGTGALLRAAKVVVAGDTGVMHMSTAVRTPVVALFGPTVEPFGFFPYRAPSTVLELPMPCRPCSKMGGPACPLGHHRCLRDIEPEHVVSAVEGWL